MRILLNVAMGAAVVIVVFLAIALMDTAWEQAHTYYPAPESQTTFLRTYSLKSAVLPFVEPSGGTSDLSGSGGGAGMESVEHTADFGEYFTIRSERKGLLLPAVYYDIRQQLKTSGVQVLSQSGDLSNGFTFRYRSGNSFGTVTVHPLEPGKVQRNLALANDLEDVGIRVEIKEEWFPKGISAEVAQALPEPAM